MNFPMPPPTITEVWSGPADAAALAELATQQPCEVGVEVIV
jgi:hypothetical protein